MSADRQRLTSAIRRIAKTDPEIRGLLDAADNKGGKPGAAGIGSSSDAESQRVCCDGSVSDNANPGTDARDPTDGDQDGLDPDDPADLSGLDGGCLTGVTNCETGEAVCFCGDGFIPPDGWDDPSSPPPADNWYEGYFWTVSTSTGRTPCEAAENAIIASDPNNLEIYGCEYTGDSESGQACVEYFGNGAGRIACFTATRETCEGTHATQSYCTTVPQGETEWPSDSCVNLAVKGGTIVGSKYDPENDGSYSAPRESIDLCDGAGNQISLAPAADGGWKTINSTTNNGYLYDSSGQQIAHIDGNEYSDPSV